MSSTMIDYFILADFAVWHRIHFTMRQGKEINETKYEYFNILFEIENVSLLMIVCRKNDRKIILDFHR